MINRATPLKVYFWPKRQAKSNHAFIYCRIKYNGVDATDFSTFIRHTESWNQEAQIFLDKTAKAENNQLSEISDDIQLLLKELKRKGDVTASDLRNMYVKRKENKTLLQIYDEHLAAMKAGQGRKGFSPGTLKAHRTLDKVTRSFLGSKKLKDIALMDIRLSHGKEFIKYLRNVKKYSQNYVVRNLNYVKNMLDTARKDGYLATNPFENLVEQKEAPGPIIFLSEAELRLMTNNPLLCGHLERVADAFLLQCFTGLAYCDLRRFDSTRHITELRGRRIIQFTRQKNSASFTIPVLPQVDALLKKYEGRIPIISNQKMNDYLKVIALTVGINKRLTTHVGRKTAGTFLLNHDVPMEVVSKILGHASVKTTEKVYAVLLQETILRTTAHLVAA